MVFSVAPFSEEAFTVKARGDVEKLTLYYECAGKMPTSPLYHFVAAPAEIGKSGGIKIFFWWKLTRLHHEREAVQLDYAIYEEVSGAKSEK